jgi:hypothetical protein
MQQHARLAGLEELRQLRKKAHKNKMRPAKLLLEGCHWISLPKDDLDVILEELKAGQGMAALRMQALAATPPKLGLTSRDKKLEQRALRIRVVFLGPMHGRTLLSNCTFLLQTHRNMQCNDMNCAFWEVSGTDAPNLHHVVPLLPPEILLCWAFLVHCNPN